MRSTNFILSLIVTFLGVETGLPGEANAQSITPTDTVEVMMLIEKSGRLRFEDPDSSLFYARKALQLAEQTNYTLGEAIALNFIGEELRMAGDYPQALDAFYKSLRISRSLKNKAQQSINSIFIGYAYIELDEPRQAVGWLLTALKLNEDEQKYVGGFSSVILRAFCLTSIGLAYTKLNLLDSALAFTEQAFELMPNINFEQAAANPLKSDILNQFGNVYWSLGDYKKSINYYWEVARTNLLLNSGFAQARLAEYYLDINVKLDSSLYYARLALYSGVKSRQKVSELEAARLLAKVFGNKNQFDSANYYNERVIDLTTELFGPKKFHQLQLLAINEQQQQFEIKRLEEDFRNSVRTYILLALSGVAALISVIFYRSKQQKNKANKVLESTLHDLKSTQSQLIQSEKMASLGELTAGIAHEIQNPLNFVNNFSEVNAELADELEEEVRKGNLNGILAIARDIKENEQKIIHHGRRADAIVKGMLQHSRSSGIKEPTDINALADEYLRLAYHGLRAKDKSFNATLNTNFDKTIGNLNVVPQDIGRAILNLITNAFYAVTEMKKQQPDGYEPTINITTKKSDNMILLSVRDNGIGIPNKVLDKIFQPFFTTKRSGQGTGLGLSLSYDVVKAHGGELKVETKEGEGSEFIILMPVQ